jgi:hypothetical protein
VTRHRLVALALVLAGVPAGQAYHYSVGSQDAVGVGPEETSTNPATSSALYEGGTSTDCTTRPDDPDQAAEAAREAPGHDPFCGRLVYPEGSS